MEIAAIKLNSETFLVAPFIFMGRFLGSFELLYFGSVVLIGCSVKKCRLKLFILVRILLCG